MGTAREPQTVKLICDPQDYGIRMATLTFATNDPSQPVVSYNLTCDGIPTPTDFLAAPGQSLSDVSNIDGANGLAKLHQIGGLTIAQDEQSSVVYGMPYEAVTRSAVDQVLPLAQIALLLQQMAQPQIQELQFNEHQVAAPSLSSER